MIIFFQTNTQYAGMLAYGFVCDVTPLNKTKLMTQICTK
jgi:hypothetical protein